MQNIASMTFEAMNLIQHMRVHQYILFRLCKSEITIVWKV